MCRYEAISSGQQHLHSEFESLIKTGIDDERDLGGGLVVGLLVDLIHRTSPHLFILSKSWLSG